MNKKYKLHFKILGEIFLLIGIIFAISGIENANAQWVGGGNVVRCKSWKYLYHKHYRGGGSYTDVPTEYITACQEWEVNAGEILKYLDLNGTNIVNSVPNEVFAKKIIESTDAVMVQRIYDPNNLSNTR